MWNQRILKFNERIKKIIIVFNNYCFFDDRCIWFIVFVRFIYITFNMTLIFYIALFNLKWWSVQIFVFMWFFMKRFNRCVLWRIDVAFLEWDDICVFRWFLISWLIKFVQFSFFSWRNVKIFDVCIKFLWFERFEIFRNRNKQNWWKLWIWIWVNNLIYR